MFSYKSDFDQNKLKVVIETEEDLRKEFDFLHQIAN